MTLQIYNPNFNEGDAPLPNLELDCEKLGQQLFAKLVDEVKAKNGASPETLKSVSRQEQARFLMTVLNRFHSKPPKLKDYQTGVEIQKAHSGVQVAIVNEAMDRLVNDRYGDPIADRMGYELLKSLLRKKLPYQGSDISKMLKLVITDSMTGIQLPLTSIMSNIERFVEQNELTHSAKHSLTKLTKTFHPNAYTAEERKIGLKIEQILNAKPKRDKESKANKSEQGPLKVPPSVFGNGEAWTDELQIELEKLSCQSRIVWHELLDHCSTAAASKPSKKWLKQANEILQQIPNEQFAQVVCPVLQQIGQAGKCQRVSYGGRVRYREPTEIHDTHVDTLRGLVWTASLVDNEQLIGALGDGAEKCFQKIREFGPRCPKVGNACLLALSSLATVPAVAQLGRLKGRAKHVSTRKQIEKAYARAAEATGMTQDDLVEIAVPDFGITTPGLIEETMGDFTTKVILHPNRKPEWTWSKQGASDRKRKSQKTVPAAVKKEHAESLKSIKRKVKDIEKLIPSIRSRIERLFLSNRNWNLKDFCDRFIHHPVVSVVAAKLIWNLQIDDRTIPALWQDGRFMDAEDNPVANVNESTRVSIWHPIEGAVDEVLRWRTLLSSKEICQPFKQVHREIYVLTDAEKQTNTYSNRFAGHIIRQHQMSALCSGRGWRYSLQGDWDSHNTPYLDLPQPGFRAEFFVQPAEGANGLTEALMYTHLSTDQVLFTRLNDDGQRHQGEAARLEEVPALVFSEVMRDVDLLVGVTSIGNDPAWQDTGEPVHTEYWEQFSFGELSEMAKTRKQTIESILPQLKLTDRCRIDGRFLMVKGKIREYKIHLGSSNILMSPNDQYLCVVQKRGSGARRTDNLFLPFEGDNTLSLILSKALMLLDDDKIKDATIASQIRLD